MSYAAPGRRAVVDALAETPLAALDHALRLEDQPPPDPASLAPDDVVIAVESAAVGWVDLLMMSGQYQHVPEPPYTPGLEFAGEVVWRGERAGSVELGAKVIADGLRTGPRSIGGHRRWGGFASYAVAPASALIPLPEGLSFDEGACLLGGAETAFHALVHRAKVQPGEVVLVLGASGSTGLAAVAMAKLLGATVLAAGRSLAKLEAARGQGADHLVLLGGEGAPRLRDEVKRLSNGRGADIIYDPVGGDLSAEGLRAAAFGARFLVVGWAGTPFVARGGRDPNVLPTNLILMKSIDVLGSPAAISVMRDPSIREERLARILAWVREGKLRPHISATFPFAELCDALRAKWEGRHAGNLVVHP
ncbi:MAG: NADPH:quinone oxidoreductase family protein [Minicystis sp.]